MPSSSTRHRLEIPLDLYQALNQAAADAVMPTNALATMWLSRMLQVRRPDLHVRDPYRSGIEQFEHRPRRAGELPDDVSLADLLTATALQDEADPAPAALPPPPALLATVTFSQQKEATPPLSDRPPTQS